MQNGILKRQPLKGVQDAAREAGLRGHFLDKMVNLQEPDFQHNYTERWSQAAREYLRMWNHAGAYI
jgi:hypothetical protein